MESVSPFAPGRVRAGRRCSVEKFAKPLSALDRREFRTITGVGRLTPATVHGRPDPVESHDAGRREYWHFIDAAVKDRAAAVLESLGLTVSDAVRILLTRVANEGTLPFAFASDPAAQDAWFRARVREALDDPCPPVPHEQVEAHFANRRAIALRKAGKGAV